MYLKQSSFIVLLCYSARTLGHFSVDAQGVSQPANPLTSNFGCWSDFVANYTLYTKGDFLKISICLAVLFTFNFLWRMMDARMFDLDGKLMPGPRSNLSGKNFLSVIKKARKSKQVSLAVLDMINTVGDGNLCCGKVYGKNIVIAAHPESVKVILQGNHNKFPKDPKYARFQFLFGQGLVTSSGDKWKQDRHLMNLGFYSENLKGMVSVFNLHCTQLLQSWVSRLSQNPITGFQSLKSDLTREMSNLTLAIICQSAFGYKLSSYVDVKESSTFDDMNVLMDELNQRIVDPFDWWPYIFPKRRSQVRKALENWMSLLEDIISQRMEAPNDEPAKDLLDIILRVGKDQKTHLSQREVRDHCLTFLVAGHETTSGTLSWVFYELSRNPAVLELCHKEIDANWCFCKSNNELTVSHEDIAKCIYLGQVIKETMRLHPTVPVISRRNKEECQLGQYRLPGNTVLSISVLALQRHPSFWEEPELFKPERFAPEAIKNTLKHPFQFVPFSSGPRNCIGQRFAQMEMIVILARILSEFTIVGIDPEDERNIRFEETITYHPNNLKVNFRTRTRVD